MNNRNLKLILEENKMKSEIRDKMKYQNLAVRVLKLQAL